MLQERRDVEARLTEAEAGRLRSCEAIIGRGLGFFVEVGVALIEIRDNHLYRSEYTSFQAYCRVRWGLGKSRAYQLIDGAVVVRNLTEGRDESTTVDLPDCEAQVRPLVRLDPLAQRQAWVDAVESAPGRRPRAKDVEDAVARLRRVCPAIQRTFWSDLGSESPEPSCVPATGPAHEPADRPARRTRVGVTPRCRRLALFRTDEYPGKGPGRRPDGGDARLPLRKMLRRAGGDLHGLDRDLGMYREIVEPILRQLRAALARRRRRHGGLLMSPLATETFARLESLDPKHWTPCPDCTGSPVILRVTCRRCGGVGYRVPISTSDSGAEPAE